LDIAASGARLEFRGVVMAMEGFLGSLSFFLGCAKDGGSYMASVVAYSRRRDLSLGGTFIFVKEPPRDSSGVCGQCCKQRGRVFRQMFPGEHVLRVQRRGWM